MNINDMNVIFKNAGIVGAGGAGFPTYAKLGKQADTIILNCAECEPLLKLHQKLLTHSSSEIINVFHQLAISIGAKEAIIGIKKTYSQTINNLNENLSEYPLIRLGLLDDIYPVGDEVVLIYELTGKVIPPGGLPIDEGVVVFNVETVYNAYHSLNGNHPVTDKWVTVVGEVKNPLTVKVPLGCSASEVVEAAGGSKIAAPIYYFGGPMMGNIGSAETVITKTTNAVIVLPEDHLLINKKRRKPSVDLKRAAACCCQCSMCTDLCPRQLLGHPVEPHRFMRSAIYKAFQNPEVFTNTLYCSSCGLCENYACMQGLSPRALMADYKAGLKENGVTKAPTAIIKPINPDRKYKRVPAKRLLARLDLKRYEKDAPISDFLIEVKKVKLLLSQHIGTPSVPLVKKGEKVKKGQMIAAPGNGLSIALHASINGEVSEVTKQFISIS